MVFGRFRETDEQLELQREFHRNCLEQLYDLEQRINDQEMATLRSSFPDVWVDDQTTRELPEKVRDTLSKSSTALKSLWSGLETLQGIIDHCERAVQDLLTGLVARQSLAAIKKSNDA